MGKETIIECNGCKKKHYFPANSKIKSKVCKNLLGSYRCKIIIKNTGWREPQSNVINKPDLYRPQEHGTQRDLL